MIDVKGVDRDFLPQAVEFIWGQWGNEGNRAFYVDCITHSLDPDSLPRFYLAYEEGHIIGCIALLLSDLVSRQDLSPWVACVYVVPEYRNRGLGGQLLARAVAEAKRLGHKNAYLLTDHVGYYERYGWEYLCDAWDAWGNRGRVYHIHTSIE